MTMNTIFFAKTALSALLTASLALALSVPATAQVYKWTDEKGRTNYSSTPPLGNIKTEPIELRSVETYKASPSQTPANAGADAGGAKPAQTGAPAGAQARAEEKKGSSATNPECTDGRTNCTRGEAPEFSFKDRTDERVKPQFTIGAPPPQIQPVAPGR